MKPLDLAVRCWFLAALASILFMAAARCSKEGAPERPWNTTYTSDPNAWWSYDNWKVEKVKYPEGTRFEFETIDTDGSRRATTWVVDSVKPNATVKGIFNVQLKKVAPERGWQRSQVPPYLSFQGPIFPGRNEKLVSVKTPAGTFLAGRVWQYEKRRNVDYVADSWFVPDIPLGVQMWSRPVSEKELYNLPADGTIPPGTFLHRLVRIEKP